jgi:hypothetical protein
LFDYITTRIGGLTSSSKLLYSVISTVYRIYLRAYKQGQMLPMYANRHKLVAYNTYRCLLFFLPPNPASHVCRTR